MASFILSAFSIVFAAVYFYQTQQVPEFSLSDPLGPRAFPHVLVGCLILCGVLLALEGMKHRREAVTQPEGAEAAGGADTNLALVAAVTAWIFAYFFLFDSLGFILDTALFLAGATFFTNRGRWLTNGLVSILLPIGLFLLLRGVFDVPLPSGLLSFG